MARKTVEIEKLKRMANEYFVNSGDQFAAKREAIQDFVSSVLMDVDAYKGFRYLTQTDVKPGFSFGIIFDESEARKHVYPDQTRISFY